MRTGSQPVAGRLAGEPVPGHRRDHDVEGVRCARAVRGGIGEPADELQLLDDRAGPAVADDERERVLVLGADVDEVDVEPVDLGDEVREGVQPRLALAPVVLGRPVASEVLHECERHALRVVLDGLLLGESRRGDARPQVLEIRLGNSTVNGRIAVVPAGLSVMTAMWIPPCLGRWRRAGRKPERLVHPSRPSRCGVAHGDAHGGRAQAVIRSDPELGSTSVSSRREWIPSFMNALRRCHSTVRGLRKSLAPMSGFDRNLALVVRLAIARGVHLGSAAG